MNNPPSSPEDPFLHGELRRLPAPKAPAELMPSVLERLRAQRAQVWWRSPIFEWPLAARLGGVAILAIVAALVCYGIGWTPGPGTSSGLSEVEGGGTGGLFATAQVLWQGGAACLMALSRSLAMVPAMVWWSLAATVGVAYLGCLGLGTLIYRHLLARS